MTTKAIEWARAREIYERFGIGRTALYWLAREKRIQTSVIIRRDGRKGTRLYSVESIRQLLEAAKS
jgi:hypothetical protein